MKKSLSWNANAVIAFAVVLFACAGNAHAQQEDVPKVEVGVFFTSLTLLSPDFGGSQTQPGIGGRVSYNLTDNVAVEGEVNIQPQRDSFFSNGGDMLQGQFGVKAGKRFRKFGVFAKARPGFASFARVGEIVGFDTLTTPEGVFVVPDVRFRRKTYFSADLGGVLEFYPSRRILTRFDVGDTVIRYDSRTSALFGTPQNPILFVRPDTVRHNFQFSAGISFRF